MNKFFIICPIGFEKLLLQEIQYKWTSHFPELELPDCQVTLGGIELETQIQQGLLLNNILKLPTRILLRIKQQKCRDLPKLFNILKKINWKEYLQQTNLKFHVTAKKSRLIHTKKIENTCKEALSAYFNANQIPQKTKLVNVNEQVIHLRLNEDLLEISLDTSGEALHKREQANYRGKASIRENFSAALCLSLLGLKNHSNKVFADLMCGSGTNLMEARSFFKLNNRPFSYENWKIDLTSELKDLPDLWNIKEFVGNELDPTVYEEVSKNDFYVTNEDFFNYSSKNIDILILNPPYGKRIKIHQDKVEYFKSIISHIKGHIKPKIFGVIIPRDFASSIECKERIHFNQNGIKVSFLIF